VVLGGVVLGGGRGWVVAAAAGAFALEALFTLLNFAGVPSTLRDAIQGVIIIAAVAYSAVSFRARRRGRTDVAGPPADAEDGPPETSPAREKESPPPSGATRPAIHSLEAEG
jgi:ribose transport system permease protein